MKLSTTKSLRQEKHFDGRQLICYTDRPSDLLSLFRKTITSTPHAIALVDEHSSISYRELERQSAAVANLFQRCGLTAGERVVLLTGNCAEFGVIALAAWRSGLIVVPLNPRNVRSEVAFVLNQCQAKALIFEASLADRAPIDSQAPRCSLVLEVKQLIADSLVAEAPAETLEQWHQPEEEDVAVLLYTSGTTGRPKGAMLTHLNMIHSVLHFVDQMALQEASERSLLAVPISHVTGLVAIFLTMASIGGTTVMIREFKTPVFLQAMVKHRVTHTILVPAIYNLLLRDPEFGQCELGTWRIGGYGGAPMPETTITALGQVLPGLGLMNAYGATETTSPTTLMPAAEQRAQLDSVGRLLPCVQLRIVDDNGHDVAIGASGELWISGPMVVPGYWDNQEATAKEFDAGAWKSGDIGSIDSMGYVRVFDRKKDMINRGGYKVYSAEVENALSAHPDVLEAAVIGQADPVLGERTRAVIVLRPEVQVGAPIGVESTRPDELHTMEAELRAHCAAFLADYKVPDFFQFRQDMLPRNPNGKVLKRELRELRDL